MSTSVETGAENAAAASTDPLIQLLTGAWAMQAVATAARLEIPDVLAGGARTAEDVAAKTGADPGAMYRLLRALASLGVLERSKDGRFATTPIGDRLRIGAPGGLRDMFIGETDHVHWQSWERVADAVKTGLPRPKAVFGVPAFEYYGQHVEEGEQFGRAMQNVSNFAAAAVLEAYDFSGVRTIMAPVVFTHAESDWVQLLTDTGLVGLLAVLATLGVIVVSCLRLRTRTRLDILAIGAAVATLGAASQGVGNFSFVVMSNLLYVAAAVGVVCPYLRGKAAEHA